MIRALTYWREGLIAVAVLAIVGACHSRDVAIRERGIAEERSRVADSLLTVNATELVRVDTVYRRDTLRLTHTITTTQTLRDSLLVHLTDTLTVTRYIASSDSTIAACTETVLTCNQFHALALQRFALDSQKLRAALMAQPTRHWYDGRFSVGPGLTVAPNGSSSFGVSVQFSVFRFP